MRYWFQEDVEEEEEEEEDETEEDAIERMKTEISENHENDVNFVTGAVVSCGFIFSLSFVVGILSDFCFTAFVILGAKSSGLN